jgi:hypothetical protein
MSIKKLTVAAVAALGLSLGAYSASAGPLNGDAAFSSAKAPSTFTLVRGMGGGGMGGGMGHGGGFGGGMGGGHMGGMGMGGHMGGMGGRSFAAPGINRGFYGGRTAFYRPGIAGRGVYAGRGFPGGRAAFHNGHRGFWRHGRFFPFVGVGVGLWGWDYGYDGGSCYTNCLAAGYGAGYCSANAYNFCY